MQKLQLNALESAKRSYGMFTGALSYAPLQHPPAGITEQLTTLKSLIDAVEARAELQSSGRILEYTAARNAAAKQLLQGDLVPLKQVASIIANGADGKSLSPGFPRIINLPAKSNYQALVATARTTAKDVAPFKALFLARGLHDDFIEQIQTQADTLETAAAQFREARQANIATTADIGRLMGEIVACLRCLDVFVGRRCKADRKDGPATAAAWSSARHPRKVPATQKRDVKSPGGSVTAGSASSPNPTSSVGSTGTVNTSADHHTNVAA